MPTIATYNIPDHYKGDTFKGLAFNMQNQTTSAPIDLTDSEIKIQFRSGSNIGTVQKELSIGSGITLVDAINGQFAIDAFVIDWRAGMNYYDIQITYPDGKVKTYIKGTLKIIDDVTR